MNDADFLRNLSQMNGLTTRDECRLQRIANDIDSIVQLFSREERVKPIPIKGTVS